VFLGCKKWFLRYARVGGSKESLVEGNKIPRCAQLDQVVRATTQRPRDLRVLNDGQERLVGTSAFRRKPYVLKMRRSGFPLLAAWVLLLMSCSSHERDLPLTYLTDDFEPLRSQFNQDAGKVRLLLLLDPT